VENIEFDGAERGKTDYFMRSEHKRIFFAGKCSSMNFYFLDDEKIPCESLNLE
jgi:hypothetical protein